MPMIKVARPHLVELYGLYTPDRRRLENKIRFNLINPRWKHDEGRCCG